MARKRKKSKDSTTSRTKRQSSRGEPPASSTNDPSRTDVDAVIEIEDELDDPQARERLIAAVAGMAPETSSEDASDTGDESPTRGPSDIDEEDQWKEVADTEGEPSHVPAIGPDALVALRELRQEGITSIGEELVLDLGEATTPEDRDRLLAAALAHAEMREAVYRVPVESRRARRWKASVATLVFLAAAWVGAFPPAFLVPDHPPPLSEADQLHGVHVALLLQSQQIEAFRVREGRLPDELSQVGAPVPGIRFVKPNNRLYQLIGYTPRGEAVVYDSSAPHAAFETVSAWWAGDGGGS